MRLRPFVNVSMDRNGGSGLYVYFNLLWGERARKFKQNVTMWEKGEASKRVILRGFRWQRKEERLMQIPSAQNKKEVTIYIVTSSLLGSSTRTWTLDPLINSQVLYPTELLRNFLVFCECKYKAKSRFCKDFAKNICNFFRGNRGVAPLVTDKALEHSCSM